MEAGFLWLAATNYMVDREKMNLLDSETMAERIFDSVNKYINRNMAGMRKYADDKFAAAREHVDEVEARLLKLRADAIDQAHTSGPTTDSALAAEVEELKKLCHANERRLTRQADHLLNLQATVRKLQGKD